jgi:dihydroneopterin aldolase
LWKAAESDDLNDTISYADINDIIHQEMKIKSKLLEHVAGRIISKFMTAFHKSIILNLNLPKQLHLCREK